jgi:uncharacterized protein
MTYIPNSNNRISEIDVLRGIAIFGILLMNMVIFSLPTKMFDVSTHPWPEKINIAANWFIVFIVRDKFYHLFALLFGVSFAIMMDRIQSRNSNFTSFYLRRITVLLLIGLVHGFLIWSGDVLVIYAMLGFILLLVRNQPPRKLLLYSFLLYSIPIIVPVIKKILTIAIGSNNSHGESLDYFTLAIRQISIYSKGTFEQITIQRASETLHFYVDGLDSFIPRALSMMLFGLYLWRTGIIQNIQKYLPVLKTFLWWFLSIGLAGQLLRVTADEFSYPHEDTHFVFKFASLLLNTYSVPILTFGYAITIILLLQKARWKLIFLPISSVGRMAITNYLFHSIFCTTLFYSYGFGLYGKIEPADGILLALGIFVFQIGFSDWWLTHFKFGPVEWLWRSLTYQKLQPMRPHPDH